MNFKLASIIAAAFLTTSLANAGELLSSAQLDGVTAGGASYEESTGKDNGYNHNKGGDRDQDRGYDKKGKKCKWKKHHRAPKVVYSADASAKATADAIGNQVNTKTFTDAFAFQGSSGIPSVASSVSKSAASAK